jgi:hypothetical protein
MIGQQIHWEPHIVDCPRTLGFGLCQALPKLLKVNLLPQPHGQVDLGQSRMHGAHFVPRPHLTHRLLQ